MGVLQLLEEGFDGIDFGSEVILFGPPLVSTPGGGALLEKEIIAVGKRLRGQDVGKCVKHALETHGSLSKSIILLALPRFESAVRVELLPTVKDIANTDVQRIRDLAWEAVKSINLARGTWLLSEPSAVGDCGAIAGREIGP